MTTPGVFAHPWLIVAAFSLIALVVVGLVASSGKPPPKPWENAEDDEQ